MSSILIAEDEERISSFVQKGLKAAGYSSTVVATGPDALRHALTDEYDLILLDVGLPELDGFEVLRRLRLDNDSVPVIMLTARTSVSDTVAGLDGGANDYMPKPFRFDELLARIRLRLRDAGQSASVALSYGTLSLDL